MTPTRRSRSWFFLLVLPCALLALGWGGTGHRFINGHAVIHLPPSMALFIQDSLLFVQHASDADNRKGADATEGPKHFIDLESYPDHTHLTGRLDSVVAVLGWTAVEQYGILPWATVWAYDSLVAQLRRGDWTKVVQTASDLGHYVGDGHQPLHNTVNYDGQLTGNSGIHSRYETGMINNAATLTAYPEQADYVADRFSFALHYSIAARGLTDSIMAADNAAKAASGWNGVNPPPLSYYTQLWLRTNAYTSREIQEATHALASLWYSAWIDAGLIVIAGVQTPSDPIPASFALEQNYPNPFNPKTGVRFQVSGVSDVKLVVYDVLGREAAVLVDERKAPGSYEASFNASGLASGVYIYRLVAGTYAQSRKMMLLK